MIKRRRKKVLILMSVCMFVVMMGLSITTSVNGTNFSLSGLCAIASGTSGGSGSCTGNPCSSCELVEDWNSTGKEGCNCNDYRPDTYCDHST